MKQPKVKTDPVMEAIKKKLFGIGEVPPQGHYRMIGEAAKAGAEALRAADERKPEECMHYDRDSGESCIDNYGGYHYAKCPCAAWEKEEGE